MMNIWCKITFTLLTAVLLSGEAIQEKCSVVQPVLVHIASIGSSVMLNCSFQLPANVQQFRISWHYTTTSHVACNSLPESLFSTVQSNKENKTEEDAEGQFYMETGDTWSILTLKRFELQDRGTYICHVIVEIPILASCCGNGTKAEMEKHWTQGEGVQEMWWIWLVVGVGVIMLASSMLGFFIFRKKIEAANPIYVNVSHARSRAPAGTARHPRAHPRPRSSAQPAQPKSLEELSVPKRPCNTNSLKAQG